VAELTTFPDFLVAKGGITSNDVAVEASNSDTVCYDENQTVRIYAEQIRVANVLNELVPAQ
jgi:hypothetical protein